jgi:hypothetical protein
VNTDCACAVLRRPVSAGFGSLIVSRAGTPAFTDARQLEAIGAGVQLSTEGVAADRLRTAVTAALSKATRTRELRAKVRSAGGVAVAADTVQQLCAPEDP